MFFVEKHAHQMWKIFTKKTTQNFYAFYLEKRLHKRDKMVWIFLLRDLLEHPSSMIRCIRSFGAQQSMNHGPRRWLAQLTIQCLNRYLTSKLTIARAVIDSFIHLLSSRRWPITMQAQSRDAKILIETTDAWSDVETIPIFIRTEANSNAIVLKMAELVLQSEWRNQNQFIIVNLLSLNNKLDLRKIQLWTSVALNSHTAFIGRGMQLEK